MSELVQTDTLDGWQPVRCHWALAPLSGGSLRFDPTGELILLALPKFEKGRTFYRSMLRAKVQQIDPAKSLKRTFPDKAEWLGILQQLQNAGELTFAEDRDEIVAPLP